MKELIKSIEEICMHLENISTALNFTPELTFTTKVAHVLMSSMYDKDKLNCIYTLYFQMAWPEKELSKEQKELLDKII